MTASQSARNSSDKKNHSSGAKDKPPKHKFF